MKYAKIRHLDISNGEGVRISLFVSGCTFHCHGCFNEDAQDFSCGTTYTSDTERELLEALQDDVISGLSILGGDPLCQDYNGLEALLDLCARTRQLGKTIWLWSGYTWEQIFNNQNDTMDVMRRKLICYTDVFIDGTYHDFEADRFLKWKGSANQRVINVQESLYTGEIVLWDT